MWTDATREKYEREAHRYASDLSDTEWCVIEPHMPPARALGRPRKTDMREVMTAILYMARSGCQWRILPGEFGRSRRLAKDFKATVESALAWLLIASIQVFIRRERPCLAPDSIQVMKINDSFPARL